MKKDLEREHIVSTSELPFSIGRLFENGYSKQEILKEVKKFNIDNDTEFSLRERLHDYELKVVDFKNNHLLMNWSRGAGATFTFACLIVLNKPRYVMYQNHYDPIGSIYNKIKEIMHIEPNFKKNINDICYKKKSLKIEWTSGEITEIYSYRCAKEKIFSCDITYDYLIFDGQLPFSVDFKHLKVISAISVNKKYIHIKELLPQCMTSEVGLKQMFNLDMISKGQVNEIKEMNYTIYKSEMDILNEFD